MFFSSLLIAQNGGTVSFPDARSVAMGSPVAITSTGVYSIMANPANLAIQNSTVELSTVFPIPSINASFKNEFLSFSDLEYYFGGVRDDNGNLVGRYLDKSEKDILLSKFDDNSRIQTNTSYNIFSISVSPGKDIGSFGFAVNGIIAQRTYIPKDLVDLALNGNKIGKTYYLNNFALSTSYLREYDFSYARDFSNLFDNIFESFSAGITLKFISGFAYSEVENVNTTVRTLEDHSILIENDFDAKVAISPDLGIEWDFDDTPKTQNISPFMTPAGSGFGLNLGFAAKLDSIWSFGLSLTNIGSVNWKKEVVDFKSSGSYLITNIIDSTLTDSLTSALEPVGSYGNGFSTPLPTVLRLGASFRLDRLLEGNFPGKMLVVIGYNQGFNNSLNNSTNPHISLGFEWKPIDLLPIRSGFSLGGFDGFAWSLGFGIDTDVLEFSFAGADMVSVINGNDAQIVQFTIGSRWKF